MIQTQSDGSPITQAFIEAASQPFVGYDVKLYSGGVDTGWGIQRLSIQLGAGASQGDAFEDFALGGLQCSQMEGTLYDVAADPVGSEIELRVGVEVSEGAYEYVTVANMTVTSAKEWQGITTFTAAGFGFKLNAPLGISGDLSPQQIATAVEAACGVPVALGAFSALPSAIPVGDGATCRRAVEELALRCAGYACETNGGGVMVAPFASAPTCSIREDIITAAPEVGEEWQADGLTVTAAEAEYTYGTGRVKASVPDATQQIAALMWGNLTGYAYTPARIRVAVADPRITPFDVMAVPYGQGTVNVPARGIELTCDGGYFGTFSAAGLTAEAEEALVEGELTRDVRMAKEAAEEAQAVADAVNQHFWTDQQGIHVTELEQDEFIADPAGANILENANGILLRDGETWLSQFTPGNVAFYDGQGNASANISAQIGATAAQIGKSSAGSKNVRMDANGIYIRNGEDDIASFEQDAIKLGDISAAIQLGNRGFIRNLPVVNTPLGTNTALGIEGWNGVEHSEDGAVQIGAVNSLLPQVTLEQNFEKGEYVRIKVGGGTEGLHHGIIMTSPPYSAPNDPNTLEIMSIDDLQLRSYGKTVDISAYGPNNLSGTIKLSAANFIINTKQAFKRALGIGMADGPSEQNFEVTASNGADQVFSMNATCINANNQGQKGNRFLLIPRNNGIGLYNSTNSAWMWNVSNLTPTVTDAPQSIIAVDRNIARVAEARRVIFGKVCQVYFAWENFNDVTVGPNGDITDITIGTLTSAARPAIYCAGTSNGNLGGTGAFYDVSPTGAVKLTACNGTGAQRTIAAGTTFYFYTTFIMP